MPRLLGALIVYRGIYYLLPLFTATLALGIFEALRRQALLARVWGVAARVWTSLFVPVLSLTVFVAGAILLFSGSLPAVGER
ncbi:MAG: hypothetical protein WAU91_09900 [Desulfatitalea sp.]